MWERSAKGEGERGAAVTTQTTDKLRELILYVSLKSEGDEGFGATKLNKLLFFIDLEALRQLGQTVTGQEYQKRDYGPVPKKMEGVLRTLQDAGDIVIRERRVWVYPQRRPFALREPILDGFLPREICLIDCILERYKGMMASQISHESHDFLGWRIVDTLDTIPIGAGLISERPLTDGERAYAKQLAAMPEDRKVHAV